MATTWKHIESNDFSIKQARAPIAGKIWQAARVVCATVFGSLIAFNAYMVLLAETPAAVASSYSYVNPVIAMLLGVGLGGELISARGDPSEEWNACAKGAVRVSSTSITGKQITLTYVVVHLWDKRRLVVPVTQFIEKPFQNWTRRSSDIVGTVLLRVKHRQATAA